MPKSRVGDVVTTDADQAFTIYRETTVESHDDPSKSEVVLVFQFHLSVTVALRGEPVDISLENSGYVVTTLQAGLYHGLTAETAEDAIVDAVMMGGDTDTIGAVTGAVAGARFSVDALPERWLTEIDEAGELRQLASDVIKLRSN